MENLFIAEAAIQKQNVNGIFQDTTPTLGSFAGSSGHRLCGGGRCDIDFQ